MDGKLEEEAARRPQGRIGGRVARGAGLLWFLSMGLRSISFLTTLVLARLLTPADFGLVALAGAVAGVIDILSNVQTSAAIIKEDRPDRGHFDTAFTINLLRSALTAAILVAAAGPIATFMNSPNLAPVLYALILPSVALGLTNPYFILYARQLDFRLETRRRAAAAVIGSVAAIIIAVATRSYWALVASSVLNAVVMVALSYWKVPGRPRLSLSHWRDIFGFGSWLLVYRLLQYVGNRFDFFYIPRVMDKATLGAYSVSAQINRAASGDIVPVLSKALFPAFSAMASQPERMRRNYVRVQAVAVATALPIGVGMGLLAEPMILLILGRQWDLAILITQILAPVLSLQALSAGSEGVAMALDRARLLATRSSVFVAARILAVVAGFNLGGFIGLLVARALLSGLVFPAYNLVLGARLTGGRWLDSLAASWRSFVAAGVMALGLWLLPDPAWREIGIIELGVRFAGRILFAAGAYAGMHMLLWRLAGRPEESPERLFIEQAQKAGARWRARRS